MRRHWWAAIVLLPIAGAIAWEGIQWATDNGIERYIHIAMCRLGMQPCVVEHPVFVRTIVFSSGPISLSGAKVSIAGSESTDGRLSAFAIELQKRIEADGGTVTSSLQEADMQVMLSYEGSSEHSARLRGWGRATRLVALDISRVRARSSTATYVGMRAVDFEPLRQVHFHPFGSFVSMEGAVLEAIDLMMSGLHEAVPAGQAIVWRSVSFASVDDSAP